MKAVSRYRELVDKKYIEGLTLKETKELSDLSKVIDKKSENFYRPIIKKLEKMKED